MSTTVEARAHCALRTSDCWDKLRDLALAKDYVPGVRSVHFVTNNHTGLGATRVVQSPMGKLEETVVEWHEGRGFLLRLHKGDRPPWPMSEASFRYAIEPDGVGTRIELSMSYAFGWGWLGRVIERGVRRFMQRNVDRIAVRLARFWETGSAEG